MNNEVKFNIREFILGGHAEFTIVQDPVGSRPGMEARYNVYLSSRNQNMYFVYTQSLGDGKLAYHGYILHSGDAYRYLKAKTLKIPDECYNQAAVSALQWVYMRGDNLPPAVHVLHHGKCARCGRPLVDTESLAYGFGPECLRKIRGE